LHQAAAEALGLSLWPVEILRPDDIVPAFVKIVQDHADGIVRGPGAALFNWRARIGAAALKHRLPVMTYVEEEEVPHGLLMSYGQDTPDFFRRTAVYVDKILKGAKPADLPVEQPTKFKLVLNLKTAKALGITFPQTLIVSADELIGFTPASNLPPPTPIQWVFMIGMVVVMLVMALAIFATH
jgi:putative tryptophan/tyrosine transport system substrate-binding protein